MMASYVLVEMTVFGTRIFMEAYAMRDYARWVDRSPHSMRAHLVAVRHRLPPGLLPYAKSLTRSHGR